MNGARDVPVQLISGGEQGPPGRTALRVLVDAGVLPEGTTEQEFGIWLRSNAEIAAEAAEEATRKAGAAGQSAAAVEALAEAVDGLAQLAALKAAEAAHSATVAGNAKADAEAARDQIVGFGIYATFALFQAAAVSAHVKTATLLGYSSAGDGGGELWRRVASQPTHPGRCRTADRFLPNGSLSGSSGGWWEFAGTEVSPDQVGVVGGVDDTAAVEAALAVGVALKIPVALRRQHPVADAIVEGGVDLEIRGAGGGGLKGIAGQTSRLLTVRNAVRPRIAGLTVDGLMDSVVLVEDTIDFGDAAINVEYSEAPVVEHNVLTNFIWRGIKTLECDRAEIRHNRYSDFKGGASVCYGGDDCRIYGEIARNMTDAAYYERHCFDQSVSPSQPNWQAIGGKSNRNAIIENCRAYNIACSFSQFTGSENVTWRGNKGERVGWNVVKLDGVTGTKVLELFDFRKLGGYGAYLSGGAAVGPTVGKVNLRNGKFHEFSTDYEFGRSTDAGVGFKHAVREPPADTEIVDVEVDGSVGFAMHFTKSGLKVRGGRIANAQLGIAIDAEMGDLVIDGVDFDTISEQGIRVTTNTAKELKSGRIANCSFKNVGTLVGGTTSQQSSIDLGLSPVGVVVEDNLFYPSHSGRPVYVAPTGAAIVYRNNRHDVSAPGAGGATTNWRNNLSLGRTTDVSLEMGNMYVGEFARNFGAIANGASATYDIPIAGVLSTDAYRIMATTALPTGVTLSLAYQSANTARVTVANASGASQDINITFRVMIREA